MFNGRFIEQKVVWYCKSKINLQFEDAQGELLKRFNQIASFLDYII